MINHISKYVAIDAPRDSNNMLERLYVGGGYVSYQEFQDSTVTKDFKVFSKKYGLTPIVLGNGADLNDITRNTFFTANKLCANTPYPEGNFIGISAAHVTATGFGFQIACGANENQKTSKTRAVYIRHNYNNVWGEWDKILTSDNQTSNPNLLDNPWFTVNQRGQTSYTGMGYGVDRWKSYSSANTVEVNSDGSITVTNTGDERTYFGQVADMEYVKKLKGKTVTLSIDGFCSSGTYLYFHIKNGSVGENISDAAKNKIGTTRAIYSMTITVPDNDFTYSEWLNFSINPGESVTIYSAKVELGSVSTLHLDTVPNYQQELAKCQRYYQRTNIQAGAAIAHGCIRSVNANTKTAVYGIFIHTSQPMLKVPLIGYNNLKIYDFMSGDDVMVDETLTGLNKIKIKDLSIYTYSDTMIQLKLSTRNTTTKGTELVQGGVAALLADDAWTDSYIEFSAEL